MAQAGTELPDFVWNEWHGINTMTKSAKDLPKGFSPDALNWITGWDVNTNRSDHIELRRGMALVGDRKTGSHYVTGLGVGIQENGTEVPFWSVSDGTVYYYNATSLLNDSVLTLPTAAISDWTSIEYFSGLGGEFVYVSSYNSSTYRIPVVNPTSYIDINNNQDPGSTFRGYLNFVGSRMNLWHKNGGLATSANKVDYLLSQTDFATYAGANQASSANATELAVYPVNGAGETVGTGDGTTKTFTHTLTHQSRGTVSNILVLGAITDETSVSGVTVGSTTEITVGSSASFKAGDYVIITGVTGAVGGLLNNAILQIVSVATGSITVNVDSTGSAYSSGGEVYAVEFFLDDRNGNLNSNLGGTGTINYGTGAISVTFHTAPLNTLAVISQYYYWAPLTGVERFVTDNSIGAATAYIWPQRDGGGQIQTIQPFYGSNYCFHTYKTWVETTDPNTATNSTNIPYRNLIGAAFYKSAWATGDGINFLDNSVPSYPKFQQLSIAPNTMYETIEPFDMGLEINFSQYAFDYAVVFRFDVYDVLCCQSYVNGIKRTFNDTMFVRDTRSGYWARFDYPCSQVAQYNGTLLAGLSLSPNIFTLLSGFDDDGSIINNYWNSNVTDLGFTGLKTTQRMVVEGLIQPHQSIDIYISYDQGEFSKVQTISGGGTYVSQGNPQLVGGTTVGSKNIGAGEVYANPFLIEFNLASPNYRYIQVQFVATGIGYVEIDAFTLKMNQMKSLANQPANTI